MNKIPAVAHRTPRKELFIRIKEALMEIPELELVDLDRGQLKGEKYPELFVAALIQIGSINWETMTEQNQEGRATLSITLHCRDGWADQHQHTGDTEHGLNEIDLLDKIAEKLQFLRGKQFKPLEQTSDEVVTQGMRGIFVYRQTFSTMIYRKLAPKYQNVKISVTPI